MTSKHLREIISSAPLPHPRQMMLRKEFSAYGEIGAAVARVERLRNPGRLCHLNKRFPDFAEFYHLAGRRPDPVGLQIPTVRDEVPERPPSDRDEGRSSRWAGLS